MQPTYRPFRQKSLLFAGILCFSYILSSSVAKAHASERWQHICTPHYDIIFLANMTREAQRMANTLEALYVPINKTLDVSPKRIPILLRSQIAISNGITTIGPPRRVEFFTFPPQDYNFLHTNDWLNLLAVHELRHVAQFESMVQNSNFLTPAWLLEGDAVGMETALSTGGRGRIPYFALLYKINLLEYGGFSYYKQMLGSFKHQLPDHYRLGYFMTTHLRRKYGADIISQLLQRKGIWEMINPFAFYSRCKKLTGRTLTEIYQDTNEELKALWTKQLEGLHITPLQAIHQRDAAEYIDYSYPQFIHEGVIVLKSGIGTITHFAYLDAQGQESKIFTPGLVNSSVRFSVAKDQIVWIETMLPLRWGHKSYTAIQSYNLTTKKFETVAYPSRYNYVALSPDATKLVACETDETYHHQLVILDAATGTPLHTFPNPENHYYLTPSWSPDGKHIIVTKHAHNQSTITLIDVQTGASEDILPATDELIGSPILHHAYVYHNSAYSGIDNIYAVNLKTKQRFQVTSSKYGAYNPAISSDGKWLLYNDFGQDGMNAVRIPVDTTQWTPIEKVEDRSIRYYESLITQENSADILAHIPDSTYAIEPYRYWNNLSLTLKFLQRKHYNSRKSDFGLGLTLQDLLGTTEWMIVGISGLKTPNNLFTSFTYKGWYPIITIEGSLTSKMKEAQKHKNQLLKGLIINLQIPFTWSFGQHTHNITLNTTSQFTNRKIANSKWNYIQNYIASFFRSSQKSPRDIYSPWGQKLWLTYTHTTLYKTLPAQVFGAKLKLYFPGLYKHHSLRIGLTQQYNLGSSPFKLNFPISIRGKGQAINFNKPHRISIDYAFPITYPDYELTRFIYIQRLRANLFYDCSYHMNRKLPMHTIGADFIIDMPWFRIGIRCMYKITADKVTYNPLL